MRILEILSPSSGAPDTEQCKGPHEGAAFLHPQEIFFFSWECTCAFPRTPMPVLQKAPSTSPGLQVLN